MRSALATRLLAAFQNLRSRHLCFHCANLCQTVRRWLGIKSFDIQPGQEIGASKTVSNFVLGIAVRHMCREEGGGGGRCRLIAAGSRHQSIPEVWKYRIELEEVKYPREAMGYNRACLLESSVTVRLCVCWVTGRLKGTLRKLPCQFRRTQCDFLLLLLLSLLLLSFLL